VHRGSHARRPSAQERLTSVPPAEDRSVPRPGRRRSVLSSVGSSATCTTSWSSRCALAPLWSRPRATIVGAILPSSWSGAASRTSPS